MESEKVADLSPEGEAAMRIAQAVLAESNSTAPIVAGHDARHKKEPTSDALDPTSLQAEEVRHAQELDSANEPIKLRHISNRNEIPFHEKHVLVMWGLSTYRADHPLGSTFIVDNSHYNSNRDRDYHDAIEAAARSAIAEGLTFIYVLD